MTSASGVDRFPLGGPPGRELEFWLDASGVSLRRGQRAVHLARFSELTHWAVLPRGLWLATQRESRFVRVAPGASRSALNALSEAIGTWVEAEGRPQQMRAVARVDALARAPKRRLAVPAVALACVLFYAFQAPDPLLDRFASFSPAYVFAGEWWRLVTAHFAHGIFPIPVGGGFYASFPLHMVMNLLVLFVFAQVVERPLGAARTWLVMVVAGLAALAASWAVGHDRVLGASGLGAGLAGAALALELRAPERLPAWWRLPRRWFVFVLLLQLASEFVMNGAAAWFEASGRGWLPRIATAAHVGGFAGGLVRGVSAVARCVRGARTRSGPAARAPRPVAGGRGECRAVRGCLRRAATARDARGEALARHGERALRVEPDAPGPLNDLAWILVTESDAGPLELRTALELAERAVELTERSNPDLLDTLAEAQFAFGDPTAVDTIEEAIAIDPMQVYFWQQRERFLGERAPEARPDAPAAPWWLRKRLRPHVPEAEPEAWPAPELEI